MNPARIAVLLAVVAATGQAAGHGELACNPDGNQTEMNICAAETRDAADAELNLTYRRILKSGAGEPHFVEKLKAAQRAWIELRDADLDSQFPLADGDDPKFAYGSIYPLEHASAETELIRQRTQYLRKQFSNNTGR